MAGGRDTIVLLMRHGKAEERPPDGSDNIERPLTEEGKKRTGEVLTRSAAQPLSASRQVCEALRVSRKVALDRIVTSPYARCLQTAEIAGYVAGHTSVLARRLIHALAQADVRLPRGDLC
jgi:phosphohistidine phosphatase SixA